MPFPLIPVLIGAGIGAVAGGVSGDDGWDWKRALGGAFIGGATGGIGAAALGGGAVAGGALGGGALGGGAAASSVAPALSGGGWMAAGGANTAAAFGGGAAAIPSGLSGLTYGMGPQALASSGAKTGGVAGVGNQFTQAGSQFMTNRTANPNIGNQFTKAGSEFMTDKTTGSGLDYGKLGQNIQSLTQDSDANAQSEKPPPGDNPSLNSIIGQKDTVQAELDAEARRIMEFPGGQTETGLSNVAAKGGLATRYGIMKTPSGSLTGGEIVGPGTGTSDTIRSAIYPDVASKLGASSSPMGKGHRVQDAALSDGEFVITAKAVEGVGKNAGAPPGQEREYGSKLLDQAMNQWQRT